MDLHRSRPRRAAIAALLCAAGAAASLPPEVPAAAASSSQTCATGIGAARVVLADSTVVPRFYSVATIGDEEWLLTGVNLPRRGVPSEHATGSLLLVRSSGEVLEGPPGVLSPRFPPSLIDPGAGAGRPHVLWGEPEPPPAGTAHLPARMLIGPPSAIRMAAREADGGWGEPAEVFEIEGVDLWGSEPPTRGGASAPWQLVLPRPTGRHVSVLRIAPPSVSVLEVPLDRGGVVRTTLAAAGDTLHLAWAGHERDRARPSHAVLHRRSTDGGSTWSDPSVLVRSLVSPDRISLHRTPAGDLLLVWIAEPWPGEISFGVRRSSDGGLSWSEADVLALEGSVEDPRVVLGPCGSPLVLYKDGAAALHAVEWAESWGAPRALLPDLAVGDFAVGEGARVAHALASTRQAGVETLLHVPPLRSLR